MRILHCFNWKLTDIISILSEVKEQGFEAIQINPIQPLKEEGLKEWWMSYQPIDFSIGNYYGTKEDLCRLCLEAEKYGIRIFADVICNHTAGKVDDDLEPHERVNPNLRKHSEYWKPKQTVTNWKDRGDVIHNCMNLPGLNVYHPDVEDMIVKFLNDLIDCGVSGFRFDAAKSIGLLSEGYRFWPNIIYRLKKYGLFLYGEVIFEENIEVLNEYAHYMHILGNYDSSDKNTMVKYVESHDTFLSHDDLGYTRNLTSAEILKQYLSLIKEYKNTIFYTRPWDETWMSTIVKEEHQKVFVKK